MSKYTTIKVSKETLKRLHSIAGELANKEGRRISLEEAILQILDEYDILKMEKSYTTNEIEEDRKALLSLLEKKITGASPEDYKEYDFEDIGNY